MRPRCHVERQPRQGNTPVERAGYFIFLERLSRLALEMTRLLVRGPRPVNNLCGCNRTVACGERQHYFTAVITVAKPVIFPSGKRSSISATTSAFISATVAGSTPWSAAANGAAISVVMVQNSSPPLRS